MEPIFDTKALGQAIRAERKAQGMTQTDLAELSNVGIVYLSNLENGKPTAEIGKAIHVAKMLGLDLWLKKRGE